MRSCCRLRGLAQSSTTYSYSYNSTGLQQKRYRPEENQSFTGTLVATTTQYDALGRPLTVSYNDGATPTKTYSYDSGSVCGGPQNTKGRLVTASSTANTETVFGYDAMGRVNMVDQCTPSTCSGNVFFQQAYTYDQLGNLLTSSDGDGGNITATYTYSPANEVLSITSSLSNSTHPPSLISQVQNGPD